MAFVVLGGLAAPSWAGSVPAFTSPADGLLVTVSSVNVTGQADGGAALKLYRNGVVAATATATAVKTRVVPPTTSPIGILDGSLTLDGKAEISAPTVLLSDGFDSGIQPPWEQPNGGWSPVTDRKSVV